MKITYAICNWIYGEEPLEKQFIRLNKYRYDAIELMVAEPDQFNLKQARAYMEKYDLACSSICTMMTGAEAKSKRRNLIDKEKDVIKQTLEYLKGCLQIGEDLDAKLVLCVPSGVANVTDGWTEDNQKLCVTALHELGDYAKSVGKILFAIEPINRYENAFLQRGEQALELLNQTKHPQVKMMLAIRPGKSTSVVFSMPLICILLACCDLAYIGLLRRRFSHTIRGLRKNGVPSTIQCSAMMKLSDFSLIPVLHGP